MKHNFWKHLLVGGTVLLGFEACFFGLTGLPLFAPDFSAIMVRVGMLAAGWITWCVLWHEWKESQAVRQMRQSDEERKRAEKKADEWEDKYQEMLKKYEPEKWEAIQRYEFGASMAYGAGGSGPSQYQNAMGQMTLSHAQWPGISQYFGFNW